MAKTTETFATVWLAIVGCASLAGGGLVAFDRYPASVMTSRLRRGWELYDFILLCEPSRESDHLFGFALAIWGAGLLYAVIRSDWFLLSSSAVTSCILAAWLVHDANLPWAELATVTAFVSTVAVLLPVAFLVPFSRAPIGKLVSFVGRALKRLRKRC